MEPAFQSQAMRPGHPKWEQAVSRVEPLYARPGDLRSDFARDYNRILHSTAFRRLKHKTQVFYATQNDHVCTRIEHVNHVTAVARTIAETLGLNAELTSAIATGHDLGHAPFGHAGERHISRIAETELGSRFRHERNSLHFMDRIETLEAPGGVHYNLNLTYAVRDGVVSPCGQIGNAPVRPRDTAGPLGQLAANTGGEPFTWEGAVVKISDRIASLGRDIEDAIRLKILTKDELKDLRALAQRFGETTFRHINNSLLMQVFINDLCRSSSLDAGLRLSDSNVELMGELTEFNYRHIHFHERLAYFVEYAELIVNTIFKRLKATFQPDKSLSNVNQLREVCPALAGTFYEWLIKYGYPSLRRTISLKYMADRLYNPEDEDDYTRAILDYISGMTDSFAIKAFEEIISF